MTVKSQKTKQDSTSYPLKCLIGTCQWLFTKRSSRLAMEELLRR